MYILDDAEVNQPVFGNVFIMDEMGTMDENIWDKIKNSDHMFPCEKITSFSSNSNIFGNFFKDYMDRNETEDDEGILFDEG